MGTVKSPCGTKYYCQMKTKCKKIRYKLLGSVVTDTVASLILPLIVIHSVRYRIFISDKFSYL